MKIAGIDFGTMGRNERAQYFLEIWDELSREQLRELVVDSWLGAEFPALMASYDEWSEIFLTAGFCTDNWQVKPTEPVTMYRGAPDGYVEGLGWTSNFEIAKWFNDRNHLFGYKDSKIYSMTVEPKWIMAMLDGRKEDEFIINNAIYLHEKPKKEPSNQGR